MSDEPDDKEEKEKELPASFRPTPVMVERPWQPLSETGTNPNIPVMPDKLNEKLKKADDKTWNRITGVAAIFGGAVVIVAGFLVWLTHTVRTQTQETMELESKARQILETRTEVVEKRFGHYEDKQDRVEKLQEMTLDALRVAKSIRPPPIPEPVWPDGGTVIPPKKK